MNRSVPPANVCTCFCVANTSKRGLWQPPAVELVLQEAGVGDPNEVAKRLNILSGVPLLDITSEVAVLVNELLSRSILPPKAGSDAVHIAVATVNQMDYLLSWNCKHIANAHVRKMTERVFRALGYETPVICTPEELGAEQ